MYTLYSSVCRLLYSSKSNLDNITKTPSHNDTMLSPESANDKIISVNDAGEYVVLEYNKHDKTFVHYRPKYFKYK